MNRLLSVFTSALVIVMFWCLYCYYCNSFMIELPFLTWFDQIDVVRSFFNNSLKISDLLTTYGEHGMLANNVLYIINCTFFGGTTKFDVYLNDFFVLAIVCVYFVALIKSFKNNFILFLSVIIISLILFSFAQGSSGAMETQVRDGLLFSCLSMYFISNVLVSPRDISFFYFLLTVSIIIIGICVCGTLYSFAGVPLVWVVCLYYWLIKKIKIDVYRGIIFVLYCFLIPIYIYEYDILSIVSTKSSISENVTFLISNPISIFNGFASWCANGLMGWAFHESVHYSLLSWLVLGYVTFFYVILSLILFFYTKMHKFTWLPIFSIFYSIGVFAQVVLGRSTDVEWMAGEWYNVHIKIMLASVVWILLYFISYLKNNNMFMNLYLKRILISVVFIGLSFITIMALLSDKYHLERAPHVANYYKNMQQYLYYDKDKIPVMENGLTPLLHSLDKTIEAIAFYKEYNLSVYNPKYNDSNAINISTLPYFFDFRYDCNGVTGFYDIEQFGRWMGKTSSISFIVNDRNIISNSLIVVKFSIVSLFLNEKNTPLVVLPTINNHKLDAVNFYFDNKYTEMSIKIPSVLINKGMNKLVLNVENVRSPKEMNINGDERYLTFAISGLTFTNE